MNIEHILLKSGAAASMAQPRRIARNAPIAVTKAGHQPATIDPDHPPEIEHGDVITVGKRSFTIPDPNR